MRQIWTYHRKLMDFPFFDVITTHTTEYVVLLSESV